MNLDPYDRGRAHNKSHAATKGSISTVILNEATRSPAEAPANAAGDDFVSTRRTTRLKVTQWVLLITSNHSPLHNCRTTPPAFDKVPDLVQMQTQSLSNRGRCSDKSSQLR